MGNEEFLEHYGVLGMHWGKSKGQKAAETRAINAGRKKAFNKLNTRQVFNLHETAVLRGEKSANRILDLMAKDPKRTYESAAKREAGEWIAKKKQ